ncbi:MAG: hypothetical protein AB7O24_24075 [Kofleriaceae bacterium]
MPLAIADLPFHERPVLELLGFDDDREHVDHDYAGYGWARVDQIWLNDTLVTDALVVAVHSADDAEQFDGDIDLEFEVAEGAAIRSFSVRATTFLTIWLAKLPRDVGAIVLIVCNPHREQLGRVSSATCPLHYPLGDATAWLDEHDLGARIRIAAETWCTLGVP